jgi:hypothetical protein
MRKLLQALLITSALTVSAAQTDAINIISIVPAGQGLLISWTGGIPPYKLQTTEEASGDWRDASWHIYANSYFVSNALPQAYFRIRSIPDKTPPPALTGFGPRQVICGRVRFGWDKLAPDPVGGTGLRGTRIYRNGVFRFEVPLGRTAFVDRDVSVDTQYLYQATAVDMAGNESPRSGIRAVDVPACSRDITLAWDANPEPDIAGYTLYWGLESGVYTGQHNTEQITYTVPDLFSGLTYYFTVSAYNTSALEGPYSEEVIYSAP